MVAAAKPYCMVAAAKPYCMVAAAKSLKLHDRGNHAI
jgi:hypothetical protein